jgi:hypothetical protein
MIFMKRNGLLLMVLVECLLTGFGFARISKAAEDNSAAEQTSLILTPLLQAATLDSGYGSIPFSVKNNYTKAVSIVSFVKLMTTTDSGDKVPIEDFRKGVPMGGGLELRPVILQPSQTGTFDSKYSTETLAFLRENNKKMFGELSARAVGTNQRIGPCFSEAFAVPDNLASSPWTDLAEQNYFTVAVDTTKASVTPHKLTGGVWLRGSVSVPIWIKNASGQPYIAATHSVSFYITEDDGKRTPPSAKETMRTTEPILKPGESTAASCDIDLDWLKSQGYKPGDKLVAAVGGRIPNSNQVFECYSAPFELPPLPKEKPPKGAVQIPGL